jgi:hypothetical protein
MGKRGGLGSHFNLSLGLSLLSQASYSIRGLRAALRPVGKPIHGETQKLFAPGSHGVIKPDTLNETPIAALTGIGNNNVKKWALFGTSARESNDDHNFPQEKNQRGTDQGDTQSLPPYSAVKPSLRDGLGFCRRRYAGGRKPKAHRQPAAAKSFRL